MQDKVKGELVQSMTSDYSYLHQRVTRKIIIKVRLMVSSDQR